MASVAPLYSAFFRQTKSLSVVLGYRDLSTQMHSERVSNLSIAIGEHCGLTGPELEILKIGAAFHDIGKIGMPDQILLKPSRFDEIEWEVMRQHAEVGEKIMLSTELEGSRETATVIRHHHENYDGKGYPDGLAGDHIPMCSRIISLADSYDAMAVARPYHRAKPHAEIMTILWSESGQKHDPELMKVFGRIIENSRFRSA